MTEANDTKKRRRGPIAKADDSVLLESSGVTEQDTPPESTPPSEATGDGTPTGSSAPESLAEHQMRKEAEASAMMAADADKATPAMDELKAKMEARAAEEPAKGPNPYSYTINAPDRIPFGFRDPTSGDIDNAKIKEHIEHCWRIGTAPQIDGCLISHVP